MARVENWVEIGYDENVKIERWEKKNNANDFNFGEESEESFSKKGKSVILLVLSY